MVHQAIDRDALAADMLKTIPRPLRRRLQPSVAGEAIAEGIEQRRPRIIRPRSWVPMSVLRGIVGPLSDLRFERDARMQQMVRRVDERPREDQPTTA